MGFQTPLYELSEYLKWTSSGKIQVPDFQRGYKWEDAGEASVQFDSDLVSGSREEEVD